MCKIYHIHVYKVIEKYETEILAFSSEEALRKALEKVKNGKLDKLEPEMNFLSMVVDEQEVEVKR